MLISKFLELEKIHTHDNDVDMLTKPLLRKKLEICRMIVEMARFSLSCREREICQVGHVQGSTLTCIKS